MYLISRLLVRRGLINSGRKFCREAEAAHGSVGAVDSHI